MKKKILLLALCATSLLANEPTETYLDESKMDYSDPRIFIGIDGSYNYQMSNDNLDTSTLGYSIYAGVPISELELIVKKSITNSNNLELDTQNITLNIPISGTGSRSIYVGILGGEAKVTYNSSTVASHNLAEKSTTGSFYGAHIGKRYKYGQNFFGRMELEYLKYDLKTPNSVDATTLNITNNIGFIYGIEYRF